MERPDKGIEKGTKREASVAPATPPMEFAALATPPMEFRADTELVTAGRAWAARAAERARAAAARAAERACHLAQLQRAAQTSEDEARAAVQDAWAEVGQAFAAFVEADSMRDWRRREDIEVKPSQVKSTEVE